MKVHFILHSGSIELCLRHMQVYLPAIVDYVPDDIVMCIAAFLDACYIARRQDIDQQALDALKTASEKFWELREVFRNTGVRPKGFMLPRQHALFHYPRQIEDFGAPGGLCSSITESRHITAVKKPWHRLNRYEALGQMLQTNQWLDKLTAMRSDFAACGMLPGGHTSGRQASHVLKPSDLGADSGGGSEEDAWAVEGPNVLAHVVLAQTRSKSYYLLK